MSGFRVSRREVAAGWLEWLARRPSPTARESGRLCGAVPAWRGPVGVARRGCASDCDLIDTSLGT